MMVYCELWWWFIMPVTYNYACDDGLLWIVMVYCESRGVRYTWQISKRGRGIGRFAECITRQTEDLPSVKPKHSAKRPFSVILGTFFAECFGFAECILMDTRQSDHKIWPLRACLPSVLGVTLGKVSKLCRVFRPWHSAKFRNFAECFGLDTRQSWETLSSVFPSCTRQKRRHCAIR